MSTTGCTMRSTGVVVVTGGTVVVDVVDGGPGWVVEVVGPGDVVVVVDGREPPPPPAPPPDEPLPDGAAEVAVVGPPVPAPTANCNGARIGLVANCCLPSVTCKLDSPGNAASPTHSSEPRLWCPLSAARRQTSSRG